MSRAEARRFSESTCRGIEAASSISRIGFLRWAVGFLGWLTLFHPGGYAADVVTRPTTDSLNPLRCNPSVCSAALSAEDRDALGRLAYAEAGDQGEEGLAAVLYSVLNRLSSGRFGSNVTAVIEAPGQFEPVDRVGGHWHDLPGLSASQRATITTILDLIQQGRLPDPTNGAMFFQNPRIVANREAAGQVRAGLTNFGNQTPTAVVRDHAFFSGLQPGTSPAVNASPEGHLVYPPGATPAFRVERLDAGTPANPHAVIYRVMPPSGTQTGSVPVGLERKP